MDLLLDKFFINALLFSFVLGLFYAIENKPKTFLHSLYLFLFFIFLVENYGQHLNNIYQPNYWVFNYSTSVEFLYYNFLLISFYYNKKFVTTFYIINISLALIFLVNIIFFQGKTGFHTITYGIGSLLIIANCIYYFYQLLHYPSLSKLHRQPQFWIVTALLFSYVASFPIFCLNNFYANEIAESIWPIIASINSAIYIIFYSLFSVAFLCKTKN